VRVIRVPPTLLFCQILLAAEATGVSSPIHETLAVVTAEFRWPPEIEVSAVEPRSWKFSAKFGRSNCVFLREYGNMMKSPFSL
jgi:hypothetical protein